MRYCSAGSRWHGVPGRRATTSAFATALNKGTKVSRSFNESWARIVIWRISSLEDFLALMDYGSSIPKDQNDQGPRHPGHMGGDTLGCRVGCSGVQIYIMIKSKIQNQYGMDALDVITEYLFAEVSSCELLSSASIY